MEHPSTGNLPTEMPLFPLDVVLFPHMPLPLHIFEERYKEMINRCVRDGLPFGIVLVTAAPAVGQERTHDVGCSARIAHVERLADGRMNILVVGEQRFRILDTHETLPYRTGITESISDTPADAALTVPLADEVHKLLREFLTQSLAIIGQQVDDFDLPDEPEQLSFTAACILPLDNDEKQAFLENVDTAARLRAEKQVLLREVNKLRRAAAPSTPEPVTSAQYAAYRCSN